MSTSQSCWRVKRSLQNSRCNVRCAGHLAGFSCAVEVADLCSKGGDLAQLSGIGPYLNKLILKWLRQTPAWADPPEIRHDFLTMSAAQAIREDNTALFKAIRGDLQMHTTWSDGSASVQEMAEAAATRGYSYIAITDHVKGLKIAGGIDEDELGRQADEIAELNRATSNGAFASCLR